MCRNKTVNTPITKTLLNCNPHRSRRLQASEAESFQVRSEPYRNYLYTQGAVFLVLRIRIVFTCEVWKLRFAGFCHDCLRRTSYASVMFKQAWHYVRLNRKFQQCPSKLGIVFAAPNFRFAGFCHDSTMLKQAWHCIRCSRISPPTGIQARLAVQRSSRRWKICFYTYAAPDTYAPNNCFHVLGLVRIRHVFTCKVWRLRLLSVDCNSEWKK